MEGAFKVKIWIDDNSEKTLSPRLAFLWAVPKVGERVVCDSSEDLWEVVSVQHHCCSSLVKDELPAYVDPDIHLTIHVAPVLCA